jgi:hypothetical protein
MDEKQFNRLKMLKEKYHFIYVFKPNLIKFSKSMPFDLALILDATTNLNKLNKRI